MRKTQSKKKIVHSLEYQFEVYVSANENPHIKPYTSDGKPWKMVEPIRRRKIIIQVVLNKYDNDSTKFTVDKFLFDKKPHFIYKDINDNEFFENKSYLLQYPYTLISEIYRQITYDLIASGYLNILIKDLKLISRKETKDDTILKEQEKENE